MCSGLLEKIGKWIRNRLFDDYDCCYTDMEYRGIAAMNCCCGMVGGTSATEYLSETCVSCPYLVMTKPKRN